MYQVIRLRPKFRVKGRVIAGQQKRRAADMNGFVREELSVQSPPGEHVHAMPLEKTDFFVDEGLRKGKKVLPEHRHAMRRHGPKL
jgi:hypothetical protein